VHCYKCESYRDYRCLDPFDYRPHVRVNCDFEPYVRDRKPVFCEKTTELIDGVYVTTRGCSTYQWEDVDSYLDHRNQVAIQPSTIFTMSHVFASFLPKYVCVNLFDTFVKTNLTKIVPIFVSRLYKSTEMIR
jgi:hypothetical protein